MIYKIDVESVTRKTNTFTVEAPTLYEAEQQALVFARNYIGSDSDHTICGMVKYADWEEAKEDG